MRGPQSALWGSEAIGGVIAVDGDRRRRAASLSAATEAARSASAARPLRLGHERQSEPRGGGRLAARDGIDAFGGTATATAIATSRAVCARRRSLTPVVDLAPSGFATHRAQRIRRLRSVHLPARRHAGQQPKPARRRSGLGRGRSATSPWSGQRRRFAARLEPTATSWPATPINRTCGRPADARRAGRAPLHDRRLEHRSSPRSSTNARMFKARDAVSAAHRPGSDRAITSR